MNISFTQAYLYNGLFELKPIVPSIYYYNITPSEKLLTPSVDYAGSTIKCQGSKDSE